MSAGAAVEGSSSHSSFSASTIVTALLVAFALLALRSAWVHSGVPDEVAVHAPAGFLYATTGDFAGGLGNPPLGMLWIAAPAVLAGVDYEIFGERGLFAFRLAVVALALLGGLALVVFARSLHGRAAGSAALFFMAFSPTWIAHGSLATLDVPIAVCVLVSVLCARRVAQRGALGDFALLGVALGTCAAVKVQGLAVGPLVLLQIAAARRMQSTRGNGKTFGRISSAAGGALALVIACLVVNLAYDTLPGFGGGLLPEDFVEATRRKIEHGAGGHFAYMLGEYSTRGWWSYFPLALAVKTPLPLLLAATIGAASARDRETALWVGLPALVFFAAALLSSVNIGVRHLLPIHPFLFVLAGVGLVAAWQRARPVAIALAAVYLAQALWASPHHLVWFNALAGGSPGGYRVLLDSNYDWGQHDGALRAHLAGRPGAVIDPDPRVPRSGKIWVGASALHGILGDGPAAYRWLRQREPNARVAHTWFGYDVSAASAPLAPLDRKSAPQRVALARHVLRAAGIAKLKGGSASLERVAADACFATYEYDCAMALSRRSLQRDPTDRAAFWLASEITAQRRLGVLRFSGREYLDGFAELEPAERWLEPAALSAAVSRMRAQSPLQALHERLGDEYFRSRDWRESLRHFSLAEAAEPGGFSSGFKLAWMLGAIPDSALRDGPRALQLAQGYGERTGWRTASAFDLLGVALAEAGDWEGAIAAAGGALERLTAASDADGIRERLEGYRARRPHRLRSRASLP